MSNIGELVERLVAQGIPVGEASEIIALAVAAGAATSAYRKTPGAVRQQRLRDKRKGVTKRYESVTPSQPEEALRSVTNRDESVTSDALSLSKKDIDKNIKQKRESRATQLPDGWRPSDAAWVSAVELLGQQRTEAELLKFKNHALDKGRTSKRWDAAWSNWVGRAIDYTGQQPRAGPARPLTPFQESKQTLKDIRNDLKNFASAGGAGGGQDTRLLPGHSGERPEGIRSGSGADVVNLSAGGGRSGG